MTPVQLTEKEWMAHITTVLRMLGFAVYHTHDSRRSEPGFPDLIAIKPPVLIAAELKRSKREIVTREQVHWLQLFRGCTDVRAVVWTPEDRDMIYHDLERIAHAVDQP